MNARCPGCDTDHDSSQWSAATLVGFVGGTPIIRFLAEPLPTGQRAVRRIMAVEIRRCRACSSPMGMEAELPMAVTR
jgi:hypothetical protein